tara:strand:+ start:1486 stop:1917 length:432 start_codon:yes stop_codon:yes gene_type:complete
MSWILFPALSLAVGGCVIHGTLTPGQAREVSHRWRPNAQPLDNGDVMLNPVAAANYARARVAIERCSHAVVSASDADGSLSMFILQEREESHQITAVLWNTSLRQQRARIMYDLDHWYRTHLGAKLLVTPSLSSEDVEDWYSR